MDSNDNNTNPTIDENDTGNIEEKCLLLELKDTMKTVIKRLKELEISVSNLREDEVRKFVESFFPVDNEAKKMEDAETALLKEQNALALITFIKSFGGKNARDFINKTLSRLITDEVAVEYSYKGQGRIKNTDKQNKCFKNLMICKCIYEAVQQKYNGANEDTMKESVTSWLDSTKTNFYKQM